MMHSLLILMIFDQQQQQQQQIQMQEELDNQALEEQERAIAQLEVKPHSYIIF